MRENDLISVPAGTHWFDMGSEPNFTAIRIFDNPEGWVAQFTGDAIADAYPRGLIFSPSPVERVGVRAPARTKR